jgi:excisionase family DNA binding protein
MDGPKQGELTAREVAATLGVSERTVLSYVDKGLLQAITTRRGLMRRHSFTAQAVEDCRAKIEQESR